MAHVSIDHSPIDSSRQDPTMSPSFEAEHQHQQRGTIPAIVANDAVPDAGVGGDTGSMSPSEASTRDTISSVASEPLPVADHASTKRRKSKFHIFTSLIPMLNSSPETTEKPPPPSLEETKSLHRKPVPSITSDAPQDNNHHHNHSASHSRHSSQLPEIDQATIGFALSDEPDHPPPPPPPRSAAPPPPPEGNDYPRRLTLDTSGADTNNMFRTQVRPESSILSYAPPPVPAKPQQETPTSGVLHKPRERAKSGTFHHGDHQHKDSDHHARLQAKRGSSSSPNPHGRSGSAQPASNRDSQIGLEPPAAETRPVSMVSSDGGRQSPTPDRGRLRRSFLPGSRSRSNSHDFGQASDASAAAWIMSPESNAEYNLSFLTNGDKVPELWNETGTIYVYLYPKESGRGASFKVPPWITSQSTVFTELIYADQSSPVSARSRARSFGGRDSLAVSDATRQSVVSPPPMTGEGESRLFIPNMSMPTNGQLVASNQPPSQDVERLVAVRNLFAFLTGQPLIGTPNHGTTFSVFFQIASLLREFDFTNADGSTFGDAVDLSFGFYIDQLGLADVRHSREKTIEALVLGEQMKSWPLYNEAFTHAVGKYSAILDIKSPLFSRVSMNTRQRLERAHLDLLNRQHNVNICLESFDFPGLFAGIASSTSTTEYRNIRFNKWRAAFMDMRSFVLKHYKRSFGNWPPKASSKKNSFSETGLNRQVLKALYSDLCSLYDLLVDRESVTPRVIDQAPEELDETTDPTIQALRRILGEFEHSSPPVLPPVPYDVPKFPSLATIKETYPDMPAKEQQRFERGIQAHETQLIMLKAHNLVDHMSGDSPFLDAYKDFELKAGRGASAQELAEQRIGNWLFLYVVLQSLPMLIVDAPGLQYTEGVEYFLCEPPQGNLPWLEDAGEVRKMWYEVAGGSNIVELSADVVMFSVEATYHRSHCWLAAKQWEAQANANADQGSNSSPPPSAPTQELSPLDPPNAVFQDMDPLSAPGSGAGTPISAPGPSPSPTLQPQMAIRGRTSAYRPSSIVIGLEPMAPPPPGHSMLDRSSRVFSAPVAPAAGGTLPRPSSAGNLQYMMSASSANSAPAGSHAARPRSSRGGEGGNGGGGRLASSATVGGGVGDGGATGGSTFDDILQGMDGKKGGEKKKKGIFGF